MNAGAFGGETWEWVESVQVVNREGHAFYRTSRDFDIGYRSVKGKQAEQVTENFVEGVFRFSQKSKENGMLKIRELLKKRALLQPIGTFNCGSVYRNPTGDFAASKLKGYRVGDAMISPKHANFIINVGKATSQNIEQVMATIERCVKEKFGIILQAEVKILGQDISAL
jgi:UDP-N-acetylmuramate dehydrogenase